jgi:uncharacterized protein YggT (Ycf19 family)
MSSKNHRERPALQGSNDGLVVALIVISSLIGVVIVLLIAVKVFRHYVQKRREKELGEALSRAR